MATGIDVAELVGSAVASSTAGDDVGPGLAGDAVVPQATSPSTTTDSPADASQLGILLGRLKLKMTEDLPDKIWPADIWPDNIRPAKNCALYEVLSLHGIRCIVWTTRCHID